MSKLRWSVLICLALVLVVTGAAFAWDSTNSRMIASGVTVGGVAVGGLDAREARDRLSATYAQGKLAPMTIDASGQAFELTAQRAGLVVDVDAAVSDALARSREGWFGQRVWRDLSGGREKANVTPAVTFNQAAVRAFVGRLAARADRPAVEAHLVYSPSSIRPAAGSSGHAVNQRELVGLIGKTFAIAPETRRTVEAPVRRLKPRTTVAGLADRYPTVITVSRSGFRLYLWKHLKLDRSYPIAVGMAGLETPSGLYSIQDKQENPSWHVPKSAWAGALAGKVIPPGPDNPIKARWMGIAAGAGIHGTASEGSLGSAASHGCVRMAVSDVIDLYDRVSVGDPVYIE